MGSEVLLAHSHQTILKLSTMNSTRDCFGSIFILFSIKVAGGRLSGENPCPPTLNDNPGTGKELLLDTGLLLMDAFPKF